MNPDGTIRNSAVMVHQMPERVGATGQVNDLGSARPGPNQSSRSNNPCGGVTVGPMTLAAQLASMILRSGLPETLPRDPMPLLRAWFDQAMNDKHVPNPDAIALGSVSAQGRPAVRVVLAKRIIDAPPAVVFFTNYTSRKAQELDATGVAAGVFNWDHHTRQARVEGVVSRASAADSDAYFAKRPLLSRIGAWASHQSQPIASRTELSDAVLTQMKRFGVGLTDLMGESSKPFEIPRPEFWGGYVLSIEALELWCAGGGRVHDRARWAYDRSTKAWTYATRQMP